MLRYTGKARADMYKDDTHGNWFLTDNGGYYHYDIGNNKSLGSNYEEVLPRSKHTTMRSACPLRIGNSTAGSTLKMVAWLPGAGVVLSPTGLPTLQYSPTEWHTSKI